MKHASIVPLIGGETIGQMNVFNSRPEYLLSYKPFKNNDSHLVNYLKDVPYILLDDDGKVPYSVDVINSVCPCAGLSTLSHGYGDHNDNNKWMIETATFVLGELKPKVFWGENAPGFAAKIGENVRNQLRQIGKTNGYTMSVYRTKSLLHGLPQVRERSFYFFWKDTKTPILNFYNRQYTPIENLITNIKSNFQTEVINKKTPSKDDPYYRYVLEEIHNGMSHKEFASVIEPETARNSDVLAYIEKYRNYLQVAEWMKSQGLEKEVEKCKYRYEKLKNGQSIMRRNTIIPRDYIGAFVGHYPTMLAHPVEDRYISYREAMSIMGLPEDFELLNASPGNANHICQNVPVQTATDMATEVLAYLNNERELVDSDYVMQYNASLKIDYQSNRSLHGFFQ